MKTKNERKKEIMLHALCVATATGGNHLHCGTKKAYEAVLALGGEADMRETTDEMLTTLYAHIRVGTVRMLDTEWSSISDLSFLLPKKTK